jgi:hypothetical protein
MLPIWNQNPNVAKIKSNQIWGGIFVIFKEKTRR